MGSKVIGCDMMAVERNRAEREERVRVEAHAGWGYSIWGRVLGIRSWQLPRRRCWTTALCYFARWKITVESISPMVPYVCGSFPCLESCHSSPVFIWWRGRCRTGRTGWHTPVGWKISRPWWSRIWLRSKSITPTPKHICWSKAVQQWIDSEGRVQFGPKKIFWSRGRATGGQVRSYRLRLILLSRSVPLQYVGRQVLGEDGFVLSGHGRVLSLQQL